MRTMVLFAEQHRCRVTGCGSNQPQLRMRQFKQKVNTISSIVTNVIKKKKLIDCMQLWQYHALPGMWYKQGSGCGLESMDVKVPL